MMTPKKKKDTSSILGQAMLVNLSVGMWRGRKHDAVVSQKANTKWAKTNKAGRYHKRLLAGAAPSHSALVTAAHVARILHRKHTLPWEDEGSRILPTENYFTYVEAIREAKAEFEELLEQFLVEYPQLIERAKTLLGVMFNRRDYPTAEQMRHKFHFAVQFSPLPSGDDFRVSLPAAELKTMARGIEDRITQAVSESLDDLWTRLGDAVSDLREKLDDGKYLRDTMVERVREVAEILGRLNLTKDAKLEQTRKRVLKDLSELKVDVLKENDQVRSAAAKKADAILSAMKGVYTPPPKEKK
jgi:hypothetical protein